MVILEKNLGTRIRRSPKNAAKPIIVFRFLVSSPGFWLRLIGVSPGCKGSSLMKKGGILNPAICSLLAELGQSDELLIVDAAYRGAGGEPSTPPRSIVASRNRSERAGAPRLE